MSILDEKRARETTARGSNRYSRTPEVVVTDGFGTYPSLPGVVDTELGAEEEVPPAYSEHHDQLSIHQNGFDAGAAVTGKHTNIRAYQKSHV